MSSTASPPHYPEEREQFASMLENWFQQRMIMSNKALKLMLLPLMAVLVFALGFWFSYYLPVPATVTALALLVSLLVWLVCLVAGVRIFRRMRTGDALMLRKIRSSSTAEEA